MVHIGSCHSRWPGAGAEGGAGWPAGTAAPGSVFMDADARRPDGGIYAVQKRLQVWPLVTKEFF